jgi:hypothetical protein
MFCLGFLFGLPAKLRGPSFHSLKHKFSVVKLLIAQGVEDTRETATQEKMFARNPQPRAWFFHL